MPKDAKIAPINIRLMNRDGIFYASSPELPGLHICGKTLAAVRRDVPTVIERLYMLNYQVKVVVSEAVDPATFKKSKKAPAVGEWLNFWAALGNNDRFALAA